MIPLFHILNFLIFFFSSFVAWRLYLSYKKIKGENLRYFFGAFVALAVYFCFVSIPGTILNNPFWVQVLYILSLIPLYLAPFFMLIVLCNIWHMPKLKRPLFVIVLVVIINVIALNLIYFSPTTTVAYNNFYHWMEATPLWVQAFSGTMVGIAVLLSSIFFFLEGLRTTDKHLRIRAFLIGGGMAILLVAAIFNYAISPFFFRGPLTILSSILALSGLVLCFLGIRYKIKE